MTGRLVFLAILAWSFCSAGYVEARTSRDVERARAIEQMERRLQGSPVTKRTPLNSKPASSVSVQVHAPAPVKSPNLLERIFGKPGFHETPLRPVSGKVARPAPKRMPSDSGRTKDSGGVLAVEAGSLGQSGLTPQGVSAPSSSGNSDLKNVVNSLLGHMAPMSGYGSDDAVMNAGSYRFEDFVYEQRKRDATAGAAKPPPGAAMSGASSSRLMELLAQEEGRKVQAVSGSSPEKKRESSTALLATVAQTPIVEETPATPEAEKVEPAAVGQSSTYKKALAKLQAYEAPTPLPLRAVSGFQGMMKTKPSEQSVEQDRAGVLSALQLK